MTLTNSGLTLVESLVAMFLTAITVVSLMTMQPMSWQSTANADKLGSATQIMQTELESLENDVMRGTNPLPATKDKVSVDSAFFLSSSITDKGLNKYMVHVQVTWIGNTKGIKSSMIVTRQMGFNEDDNF